MTTEMAVNGTGRPLVLVVESDESTRRLIAIGFELEGAQVIAADSRERVRVSLASGPHVDAAVIGSVPDATTAEIRSMVRDIDVDTRLAELDENVELTAETIARIARALGLPGADDVTVEASNLMAQRVDELAASWRELCHWDPMLPPDAEPPVAGAVIAAIAAALTRPQPIGWGPDPQVEAVVETFADRVGSAELVVGELVCLREVLRRWVITQVAVGELAEVSSRVEVIVDRAIQVAVSHSVDKLQQAAYLDPLTGLLNRRALERDVRRELGRASRYGRRVSIMTIDLDGLKVVNDRDGHAAGDDLLCRMARSFADGLRLGDSAYRIGGDEFVALLPETGETRVTYVAERLEELGAPEFSWGAATFPDDGESLDVLLAEADSRLYEGRRIHRA